MNTDPYLTLNVHHQRVQRLRDEAAADALAERVRAERHTPPERARPSRAQHRRRAPVIP